MSTGLASRADTRPTSTPALLLAIGCGALAFVGSSSGQLSRPMYSAISSSNLAPAAEPPHFVLSPITAPKPTSVARTTAQLLTETHEASGLTWDQIARYFGVSRRAVHLWASGGRMAASNEELLARLVHAVETVKNLKPSDRRQALLRSGSGLNLVDAERAKRSSRPTDINRAPEIGLVGDQA